MKFECGDLIAEYVDDWFLFVLSKVEGDEAEGYQIDWTEFDEDLLYDAGTGEWDWYIIEGETNFSKFEMVIIGKKDGDDDFQINLKKSVTIEKGYVRWREWER